MENTLFPLQFNQHLIFCVIGCLFFLLQFYRLRATYQLTMAIAISCSLLIYIGESRAWFYSVGILELILLILTVIFLIKQRKKERAEETAALAAAEATDTALEEVAEGTEAAEERTADETTVNGEEQS